MPKLNGTEYRFSVTAPLRICPLGAHVDHQLGLVTGMTIDKSITLFFNPRNDAKISLESAEFNGKADFELSADIPKSTLPWENYARGAASILCRKYGITKGFTGYVVGSLPVGGLSSSAAVGIAYLLALEYVNDLALSKSDNIDLDGQIEHQYFGLKNGILDQSIILMGKRGKLIYLDCKTRELKYIQAKRALADFKILIAYSGLSKPLADTKDYNNRVTECEQAATLLLEAGGLFDTSPKLGNVPAEVWATYNKLIPAVLYKRALHYFSECERVRLGAQAWEFGDLTRFGVLMTESGLSSVVNYESGCPHLIKLFNLLKSCRGVYGARFSGAGFRGSCVALIDPTYWPEIKLRVDADYKAEFPEMANLYSLHLCDQGDGAGVNVL